MELEESVNGCGMVPNIKLIYEGLSTDEVIIDFLNTAFGNASRSTFGQSIATPNGDIWPTCE